MSQSLPLFRAFQQGDNKIVHVLRIKSQSLPLFRAFQQEGIDMIEDLILLCRNPFLYSGHFNYRRFNYRNKRVF